MEFCARKEPDLLMISLSLPEDAAFTLFRSVRTNVKLKFKPVFALVVKTEMNSQNQAQQVGFSSIITKPIDLPELEARMAKAMNLDTSLRYFRIDGEFLVMSLPENCHAGRARRGGPLPQAQAGRGGRCGAEQGDHRHPPRALASHGGHQAPHAGDADLQGTGHAFRAGRQRAGSSPSARASRTPAHGRSSSRWGRPRPTSPPLRTPPPLRIRRAPSPSGS